MTMTPERVTGEFVKVSTVLKTDFTVERVATYEVTPEARGVSALTRA